MSHPERFLGELRELKAKFAQEALVPRDKDKTAFGYGKACGVAEGLSHAEALYEKLLSEQEAQERGAFSR